MGDSMTYGICSHRECERICKERRYGRPWCPTHMHNLLMDDPNFNSEPFWDGILRGGNL